MKEIYKKDNNITFLTMPDDRKNHWMKSIADGFFFVTLFDASIFF